MESGEGLGNSEVLDKQEFTRIIDRVKIVLGSSADFVFKLAAPVTMLTVCRYPNQRYLYAVTFETQPGQNEPNVAYIDVKKKGYELGLVKAFYENESGVSIITPHPHASHLQEINYLTKEAAEQQLPELFKAELQLGNPLEKRSFVPVQEAS